METFVVRLWRSAEADDELRGVVQHVRSGVERPFSSAGELDAALRRLRDTAAVVAGSIRRAGQPGRSEDGADR